MGMESVYKLSVILNMVDQLTAPMGRASQNLGSRLSGLQSGFGMAALAGGGMTPDSFQTPGPGPQRLISSQPPMTSNRASRP